MNHRFENEQGSFDSRRLGRRLWLLFFAAVITLNAVAAWLLLSIVR